MDQTTKKFPFKIQDLEPGLSAELLRKGVSDEYVQVGPKKYFFLKGYRNIASKYYNMEVRESDIFVTSQPRSGTTWTQELVWMVTNDMDYEGAQSALNFERYETIEHSIYEWLPEHKETETKANRYFKTHLPLSLLPPNLLESGKLVYIARDPRDVAVSWFYFQKMISFTSDFKTFWNNFIANLYPYGPYFEHVKEAWNMRHHPNMLFLFYEELSQDLPAAIRRVSEFFGKSYSEDQVQRLAQHLSFNNFKQNKAVNGTDPTLKINFPHRFVRKGLVGGWREHFDEEMIEQAENWITKNLRDTDLKYLHMENKQN